MKYEEKRNCDIHLNLLRQLLDREICAFFLDRETDTYYLSLAPDCRRALLGLPKPYGYEVLELQEKIGETNYG